MPTQPTKVRSVWRRDREMEREREIMVRLLLLHRQVFECNKQNLFTLKLQT